ncbi:hypothetical protein [Cohnella boryungensis]|uniref:DUF922 domain-containing protein n=1 Tax=Cohnella boryungensis TaxID=768479 RepID=A0ABV8SEU7_9BACL
MGKLVSKAAGLCAGLALLIGETSCMGPGTGMAAEQAFAMSASALSGAESYGLAGEIALYEPGGKLGSKAAYKGEVRQHGNVKLSWRTPGALTANAKNAYRPAGYRPLKLLEVMNGRNAAMAFVGGTSADGSVRLRIKLNDKTAKDRIAGELRQEIENLRTGNLAGGSREKELLATAERRLEEALATLSVDTVVYWTADSKSWFPKRMKEETALSYRWKGKAFSEKRICLTNFLASG